MPDPLLSDGIGFPLPCLRRRLGHDRESHGSRRDIPIQQTHSSIGLGPRHWVRRVSAVDATTHQDTPRRTASVPASRSVGARPRRRPTESGSRATLGFRHGRVHAALTHRIDHESAGFHAARSTSTIPAPPSPSLRPRGTPCAAGWNAPCAPWTHRALRQRHPGPHLQRPSAREPRSLAGPHRILRGIRGIRRSPVTVPPSFGRRPVHSSPNSRCWRNAKARASRLNRVPKPLGLIRAWEPGCAASRELASPMCRTLRGLLPPLPLRPDGRLPRRLLPVDDLDAWDQRDPDPALTFISRPAPWRVHTDSYRPSDSRSCLEAMTVCWVITGRVEMLAVLDATARPGL